MVASVLALLALARVLPVAAQDDRKATSRATRVVSQYATSSTCNTSYGSAPVFPLHTQSTTVGQEMHSTFTSTQTSARTTIYVTATSTSVYPPWTSTSRVTADVTATVTLAQQTLQIFETTTQTLTSLSLTETACVESATVTTYTGSWVPSTEIPNQFPILLDCTFSATTFLSSYPWVVIPKSTATIYPVASLQTITSYWTYYPTVYLQTGDAVTQTTTQTYQVVHGTKTTVTQPCAPIRTLDARCAPTNLAGGAVHNTKGINVYTNGPGAAPFYTFPSEGDDPSLCCQRCVDTKGCLGSAASPGSGNCAIILGNVTAADGRSCGLALTYGYSYGDPAPAWGAFFVQNGCGYVQEGDFGGNQ